MNILTSQAKEFKVDHLYFALRMRKIEGSEFCLGVTKTHRAPHHIEREERIHIITWRDELGLSSVKERR